MGLTNKGDSICYAVAYDDNYSLLKIEPFKRFHEYHKKDV